MIYQERLIWQDNNYYQKLISVNIFNDNFLVKYKLVF